MLGSVPHEWLLGMIEFAIFIAATIIAILATSLLGRSWIVGLSEKIRRLKWRYSVRRRGSGSVEKSGYIPPDYTIEEFVGLGSPAPAQAERVRRNAYHPKILFEHPHPAIYGVQRRVAATLFRRIGAQYLPGRLIELLAKYDAFQAVDLFLLTCGFDYNDFLENEDDREYFAQVILVIAEVDALRRRAQLNDLPFYKAIRSRDLDLVEDYAERLSWAAAVAEVLDDPERIVFPEYWNEFRERAIDFVRDWASLSKDQATEIRDIHVTYERLQALYDDSLSKVVGALKTLLAALDLEAPEHRAVEGMALEAEKIQGAVEAGGCSPAEGIEALDSLLDDIELLLREMGAGVGDDEASSDSTKRGPDKLLFDAVEALVALEIEPVSGRRYSKMELKKAYRILAKKHHPDPRGGGDADDESFKQLSMAWELIEKYFRHSGLDYLDVPVD